ncbi:Paired amphipathic helix protein Sin3a [Trichinella pseudospiralis]|uniref:Paired amphipathic helix protein Sin3a n=1 Tax=Trichinella pseudospiralis TaxID=6337 RepID=A0A0V0YK58_TRIPS|nr:Paired amphipathic helix protein Sin3a [Trichinella pseudospiralis]
MNDDSNRLRQPSSAAELAARLPLPQYTINQQLRMFKPILPALPPFYLQRLPMIRPTPLPIPINFGNTMLPGPYSTPNFQPILPAPIYTGPSTSNFISHNIGFPQPPLITSPLMRVPGSALLTDPSLPREVMFYMGKIRDHLFRTPRAYFEFLEVLEDFRYNKTDMICAVKHIAAVLYNSPELLKEMKVILPEGHEIELHGDCCAIVKPGGRADAFSLDEAVKVRLVTCLYAHRPGTLPEQALGIGLHSSHIFSSPYYQEHFNTAMNFINKVQVENIILRYYSFMLFINGSYLDQRYIHKQKVYQEFIFILNFYREYSPSIRDKYMPKVQDRVRIETKVYSMMSKILWDSPELLSEFLSFLPSTAATAKLHAQKRSVFVQTGVGTSKCRNTHLVSLLGASEEHMPTINTSSVVGRPKNRIEMQYFERNLPVNEPDNASSLEEMSNMPTNAEISEVQDIENTTSCKSNKCDREIQTDDLLIAGQMQNRADNTKQYEHFAKEILHAELAEKSEIGEIRDGSSEEVQNLAAEVKVYDIEEKESIGIKTVENIIPKDNITGAKMFIRGEDPVFIAEETQAVACWQNIIEEKEETASKNIGNFEKFHHEITDDDLLVEWTNIQDEPSISEVQNIAMEDSMLQYETLSGYDVVEEDFSDEKIVHSPLIEIETDNNVQTEIIDLTTDEVDVVNVREEPSIYENFTEEKFFKKVTDIVNKLQGYGKFLKLVNSLRNNHPSVVNLLECAKMKFKKETVAHEWIVKALSIVQNSMLEWPIVLNPLQSLEVSQVERLEESYFFLPEAYMIKRKSINEEVLNYLCFSHGIYSAKSIATPAQVAIFEQEEELCILDYIIGINCSTLNSLSNAWDKIIKLKRSEAKAVHLDDRLGGNSVSIPAKALRRMYGKLADDLIEGLTVTPYYCIPSVLKDFKEKTEEWVAARAALHLEWRKESQRLYWKALDVRGFDFREIDSKRLHVSTFISEIQRICKKRLEKNIKSDEAGPYITLLYPSEKCLFFHPGRLVMRRIMQMQNITILNKKRIRFIFQYIVPALFDMQADSSLESKSDPKTPPHIRTPTKTPLSTDSGTPKSGGSLKCRIKLSGKTGEPEVIEVSNDSSLEIEECETTKDYFENSHLWKSTPQPNGLNKMLVPEAWYFFFRLHYLFSKRLEKLFQYACDFANNYENKDMRHLYTTTKLSNVFIKKNLSDPRQLFDLGLRVIIDFVDGKLKQEVYEEQMREIFTTHAYAMFSLEKLIRSIIKQLNVMVTDPLSMRLLMEHEKYREKQYKAKTEVECYLNEIEYEREVRQFGMEKNIYSIVVDAECSAMSIHLIIFEKANVLHIPTFMLNSLFKYYLSSISDSYRNAIQPFLLHLSMIPIFQYKNMQKLVHYIRYLQFKSEIIKEEPKEEQIMQCNKTFEENFIFNELFPASKEPHYTFEYPSGDFFAGHCSNVDDFNLLTNVQNNFLEMHSKWAKSNAISNENRIHKLFLGRSEESIVSKIIIPITIRPPSFNIVIHAFYNPYKLDYFILPDDIY